VLFVQRDRVDLERLGGNVLCAVYFARLGSGSFRQRELTGFTKVHVNLLRA
jgi:hypothetical protein